LNLISKYISPLFILLVGCVELPTESFTNPLDAEEQVSKGIEPPALIFMPDTMNVNVGNPVTARVFIMGSENLRGVHLRIGYDAAALAVSSAEIGDYFPAGAQSIFVYEDHSTEGYVDIYTSYVGSDSLSTNGNANLANVVFNSTLAGETKLEFKAETELVDPVDSPIAIKGLGVGVVNAN